MNIEQQKIEYKSIQKIRTGDKGFRDLSVTCVALANAQGGQIMVGVEDKTRKPAPKQTISQEAQIAVRIPDVELKEIRKMIYSMVGKEIRKEVSRSDCTYLLT